MASGQNFRDLNYSVIKDFEPGATRISVEVKGLKAKKGLFQSKKKCKNAENATIKLEIVKSGVMGTIIMKSGKIEEHFYRIKVDKNRVGHGWMEEPDSYFWVEDNLVAIILKEDPNEQK